MINIKLNTKHDKTGKVVYNAGILNDIVALAVAEVEGTVPLQGKRNGISLYLEKDGIYVDVCVSVRYGHHIPDIAYRIQQTVKQSVENMTHYKVAEVDVHIQDVIFEDENATEKEEERAEETTLQEDKNER